MKLTQQELEIKIINDIHEKGYINFIVDLAWNFYLLKNEFDELKEQVEILKEYKIKNEGR